MKLSVLLLGALLVAGCASEGVEGHGEGDGWVDPTAAPPLHTGLIEVSNSRFVPGVLHASAFFDEASRGDSCVRKVVASCLVRRCPADWNFVPARAVSAGTITLSGSRAAPQQLVPAEGGARYSFAEWQPGEFGLTEVVTVQAAGAEVPAFTGQVAILSGSFNQHEDEPNFHFDIDRNADLALAWRPVNGVGGHVRVYVSQATEQEDLLVECELPLAGGRGSLPRAALRELWPSGGAVVATTLWMRAENVTRVRAGDYAIDLVSRVALDGGDADVR